MKFYQFYRVFRVLKMISDLDSQSKVLSVSERKFLKDLNKKIIKSKNEKSYIFISRKEHEKLHLIAIGLINERVKSERVV